MKKTVKGSKKQHAQLDADYKKLMLPADDILAFWVNASICSAWGQEKEYLSKYGQRYAKIVNISCD